jgi:hypothetical protein
MTATTGPRGLTKRLGDSPIPYRPSYPMKAGAKINHGAIVALDGGYAVAASTKLGLVAVGIADIPGGTLDNTLGADGAMSVEVRSGTHGPFVNSGGSITQAMVGSDCFLVDDQTLHATDGLQTRSVAGKVHKVDASGVYVTVAQAGADAVVKATYSVKVDLASLANAQVIDLGAMPFAGRLVGFKAITGKPATTAAKLATLTPQTKVGVAAAVPVTGGALALTSANQTPQGNCTSAAAITAGGTFAKGTNVQALVSAVTAFVEGEATLVFEFA